MTGRRRDRFTRGPVGMALAAILMLAATSASAAAPEIRTTAENTVPACVTPDRLMTFLRTRNQQLDPRFKDIARHYKVYGEAWRVRWDYAFFQMAVETNFLTYRAPNGRMGDVDPKQNNFAGIGTTGGGVPGDSFPDVKTGVHAQIQHLVVYSGERLAAPIAPRTQLKQDEILKASLALNRPVRFADLARRWAVDPKYDRSIEWVAGLYRSRHCTGRQEAEAPATRAPEPAVAAAPAPGAPEPRVTAAPRPAERPKHSAVRTIWERGQPSPKPQPAEVRRDARLVPTATASPAAVAMPVEAAASQPSASAQPIAMPSPTPADDAPAAPPSTRHAEAGRAFDPALTPPSGLGAGPMACSIGTASYGGTRTVLIKSVPGESVRYTALTVIAGFERSLTTSFINARAPGGVSIGEFDSQDAALEMARTLCGSAG